MIENGRHETSSEVSYRSRVRRFLCMFRYRINVTLMLPGDTFFSLFYVTNKGEIYNIRAVWSYSDGSIWCHLSRSLYYIMQTSLPFQLLFYSLTFSPLLAFWQQPTTSLFESRDRRSTIIGHGHGHGDAKTRAFSASSSIEYSVLTFPFHPSVCRVLPLCSSPEEWPQTLRWNRSTMTTRSDDDLHPSSSIVDGRRQRARGQRRWIVMLHYNVIFCVDNPLTIPNVSL